MKQTHTLLAALHWLLSMAEKEKKSIKSNQRKNTRESIETMLLLNEKTIPARFLIFKAKVKGKVNS